MVKVLRAFGYGAFLAMNLGLTLAAPGARAQDQGAFANDNIPHSEAFHRPVIYCTARNARGAEYSGRARGDYAYRRACDIALYECRRDSLLPGSCRVVSSGPY